MSLEKGGFHTGDDGITRIKWQSTKDPKEVADLNASHIIAKGPITNKSYEITEVPVDLSERTLHIAKTILETYEASGKDLSVTIPTPDSLDELRKILTDISVRPDQYGDLVKYSMAKKYHKLLDEQQQSQIEK